MRLRWIEEVKQGQAIVVGGAIVVKQAIVVAHASRDSKGRALSPLAACAAAERGLARRRRSSQFLALSDSFAWPQQPLLCQAGLLMKLGAAKLDLCTSKGIQNPLVYRLNTSLSHYN